jgi:hypothetical protein
MRGSAKTDRMLVEGVLRGRQAWTLLAVLGAACGEPRYWVCDEVASSRLEALPRRLSETGLFADMRSEALAPGVRPYAPRFALWSDGASKRRWLKLPPGSRIDSSDMDHWSFPQGTQVWKEFTRDGVRVETRLLQKIGPHYDDWAALAYLWNEDQTEALAVPYGASDAQGTPHDVPAASECVACHGGTRSRLLGVSAIQLGTANSDSPLTLQTLVEDELLTDPPDDRALHLPGTVIEQQVLGYLHANCSHCHNQQRPPQHGARCFDPENALDFALSASHLQDPSDTATYRSMRSVVKPGHPGKSRLLTLVSGRGFFKQMPPLATTRVDDQAVDLLRAWIEGL